jgi:hypothetical protein
LPGAGGVGCEDWATKVTVCGLATRMVQRATMLRATMLRGGREARWREAAVCAGLVGVLSTPGVPWLRRLERPAGLGWTKEAGVGEGRGSVSLVDVARAAVRWEVGWRPVLF